MEILIQGSITIKLNAEIFSIKLKVFITYVELYLDLNWYWIMIKHIRKQLW